MKQSKERGWHELGRWKAPTETGPLFSYGGGFNPETGKYTATISGLYMVTANIKLMQASALNSEFILNAAIDGSPSSFTYTNAITDFVVASQTVQVSV